MNLGSCEGRWSKFVTDLRNLQGFILYKFGWRFTLYPRTYVFIRQRLVLQRNETCWCLVETQDPVHRLLWDLPTYGGTGSQHELIVSSQWQHWWSSPRSLRCARYLTDWIYLVWCLTKYSRIIPVNDGYLFICLPGVLGCFQEHSTHTRRQRVQPQVAQRPAHLRL